MPSDEIFLRSSLLMLSANSDMPRSTAKSRIGP